MPNPAEQIDAVKEARELLANAAQGPLTLIRYEHGGGRLYHEEPRDLIADFYDAANRELYYRAPELLKTLADEVERLRRGEFTSEEFQNLCHNADIQAGFDAFADGCEAYQQKMFGRCRKGVE